MIVNLQSDPNGYITLQSICDRVEYICGLVPKTRHIYTKTMYQELLSGEINPDFIIIDNFFCAEENCDLKIIPELRVKFPKAQIVSYSVFEVANKELYDIFIDTEDNGESFSYLCQKVAASLKN